MFDHAKRLSLKALNMITVGPDQNCYLRKDYNKYITK